MYIKTTIKGISYENETTAVIPGLVLLDVEYYPPSHKATEGHYKGSFGVGIGT